jgi:hypothetical protein
LCASLRQPYSFSDMAASEHDAILCRHAVSASKALPVSDMLSPAQIRGAQGMLDWSMSDLAKATQVSVSTVQRVEI